MIVHQHQCRSNADMSKALSDLIGNNCIQVYDPLTSRAHNDKPQAYRCSFRRTAHNRDRDGICTRRQGAHGEKRGFRLCAYFIFVLKCRRNTFAQFFAQYYLKRLLTYIYA